ncbi:hypothetical protein [Brasilonema sp. UFV-L1]|uniref:hypothetical protein n=2 Tax=Brasilonema sp. UFV-L1 TaxID=2234130 RepID=UPI00145D3503|nr:hypothetical protein [Brasilonema sp. UFV-L1]NMG10466.1 hypothetical protein [Brasilonema sp. UFV-L1]
MWRDSAYRDSRRGFNLIVSSCFDMEDKQVLHPSSTVSQNIKEEINLEVRAYYQKLQNYYNQKPKFISGYKSPESGQMR